MSSAVLASNTDKSTLFDEDGLEIEQMDSISDEEDITQPYSPEAIRIASKGSSIDRIVSRIENGEIEMQPDFQRHSDLWTAKQQSRLIESMLIKIPLPAFYMDGIDDDRWIVIDGLQRLTVMKNFMIDKSLALSHMEFLTELNGKKYDDLSRKYQRRILETEIQVYLTEKGTPEEVKFNVFRRINTGGLSLTPQEIRHALYQGKATKLLKELAASVDFLNATQRKIKPERMADRECILRCIAFMLTPYGTLKNKDFDALLISTMQKLNAQNETQIEELKRHFLRAMAIAHEVFEEKAFLNFKRNSRAINKALFEIWGVNLASLSQAQQACLALRKDAVVSKMEQLLANDDFERAISSNTNNLPKVRLRFSEVEGLIQEVLA